MKFLRKIFHLQQKVQRTYLAEYKEEIITTQAREQFKKLQDIGLSVPVAYL